MYRHADEFVTAENIFDNPLSEWSIAIALSHSMSLIDANRSPLSPSFRFGNSQESYTVKDRWGIVGIFFIDQKLLNREIIVKRCALS